MFFLNATLVLAFLITLPFKVLGNDGDSTKLRIGILPVAFYTPETHLGFGGLLYSNFRTSHRDSLTKKSNTQTYLNFTSNKQALFQNDYLIFSTQNKYLFKGRIDYIHFPEFYFGLGNETKIENKTQIDFNSFLLATGFYRLVKKKVYTGLLFQQHNLWMLDQTLMSYNDDHEVYGNMGYNYSGIGISILIDNRDNSLNPRKGHYFELNGLSYYDHSKTDGSFQSILFDARWYETIRKKLVWNINAIGAFNQGNVPFRMLPAIGGARFMRGYYQGRFRDNNLILAQQEFRYPLFWRFGFACFMGMGQVAQQIGDFNAQRFHYNYGLGLRFVIDRKENASIRIDYGFTADSQGMYIVFAEAF